MLSLPEDFGDLEVEIVVETQITRTESKEKVATAVSNLFREQGKISMEYDRVQFVSTDIESLRFLKDQFRDRRVRAAARRLLVQNSQGGLQTHLLLNKQAATVSIAALCDDPKESALGSMVLRIRSNRLEKVIEWLTFGYDIVERS